MSIYPVYLASWYPKTPKTIVDHETAKTVVSVSKCLKCGSKCTWKKAWGSYNIPFGNGDVWCSKACVFEK